jgi:uncharacterized Zn finger protein
MNAELELLQSALQRHWSVAPDEKSQRYVDEFFERQRIGTRLSGRVVGNHGTYTVSIRVEGEQITSACSCYIGKHGYCHHCAALAATFLKDPASFPAVERVERDEIRGLADLHSYLAHTTLESLLMQLRELGITQAAFAQGIGATAQHLSAVKRSELRNRFHTELGALKLACLWLLEHHQKFTPDQKGSKG